MPRTKFNTKKITGAPAPTKSLAVKAVETVKKATKHVENTLKKPRGKASKSSWSGARLKVLDGILGFESCFHLESGVGIYTNQKFIDKNENPTSHVEWRNVPVPSMPPSRISPLQLHCFSLRKDTLVLKPQGTYRHAGNEYTADPILILNVYLNDGLVKPSLITSATLPIKDWTSGDLAMVQVPYNFPSPGDDIPLHIAIMEDLANHLSTGLLRRVTKIALFVSTHTDPVNGTFHSEIGNGGAVEFNELMECLFPEPLCIQLRARGGSDQLFVLACGGFWLKKNLRDQVLGFVNDIEFNHVLGFSGQDLQPLFTGAFLRQCMEMFFIHGKELYTRSILPDHATLGSHTGVVWMRPAKNGRPIAKERYVWHHPAYSPFGFPDNLPQQCPDCGILKPWTGVECRVLKGEHRVDLQCQKCGAKKTIKRANGWKKIMSGGEKEPYSPLPAGDWLVEILD
ncbi:hypothetical protein AAF712_012515 [Marasmius tenuissimus]|uniref:Uncharacterized protein n=1 Tax=Marasmius tenuissimus TaxID=585030 RepID=A0ABR2ZG93_9AGAR